MGQSGELDISNWAAVLVVFWRVANGVIDLGLGGARCGPLGASSDSWVLWIGNWALNAKEVVSTTDTANIFTIELGLFNSLSSGDTGAVMGSWDDVAVTGLAALNGSLPGSGPDG